MPSLKADPPLVEAIAELRWGIAPEAGTPTGQGMTFQIDMGQLEEFLSTFSQEMAANGFLRSERLVPHGAVAPPGVAMLRLLSGQKGVNNLVQVGSHVLTVNALPPYESWGAYDLTIRTAVEVLLRSRPAAERDQPFHSVSFRCLNAFRAGVWPQGTAASLLHEMGIGLELPSLVRDVFPANDAENFAFSVRVPVKGAKANLGFTEAHVHGEPSLLMDLSFVNCEPVPPDVEAVRNFLNVAHAFNRDVFFALVEPIKAKLNVEVWQ